MNRSILQGCAVLALLATTSQAFASGPERPRLRDTGVVIGTLDTGPRNAIVDVPGVHVGHATVIEGDTVRTGVTAIVPHPGDLFRERVPAAIVVGNGFGKLLGVTQVDELGELETPILLTGTLGVWRAADALVERQLALPGMEEVRSINPVVGETNDGYLNDIRARPLQARHVFEALDTAATDNVDEGSIGAGTGTVAFGWKGGIGTSSRRIAPDAGGYTVGVLVQSNFGGRLTIAGVPVCDALPDPQAHLALAPEVPPPSTGDGSIMIVVATDAPLDDRLLRRLATRALIGLGRTGASMSNGSGDYVIAFSTAPGVRRASSAATHRIELLSNEAMTPLFVAVADATEEAIVNSMFRATTVSGHQGTVPALPLDLVLPMLLQSNGQRPATP
ncbi:P1 family peptidase [Luteimonas fraxinea]|uniref:DmpA family aminopeptidase n=1 Tax=Luteimonas fraxinea TaxID=2901869 RepID=UPI001E659A71|nr:P1 family peptidase [Luteimonas fraxinea]MCD9126894.1 P1 family peptidase [Luteimonas fraxinea]